MAKYTTRITLFYQGKIAIIGVYNGIQMSIYSCKGVLTCLLSNVSPQQDGKSTFPSTVFLLCNCTDLNFNFSTADFISKQSNKYPYPKSWISGFTTSLHKSGSLYETSNYRGLTINSTLSKVFISILNSRLEKYVENHNILTNKQIGFRKGTRTSDHLFTLRTLIEKI